MEIGDKMKIYMSMHTKLYGVLTDKTWVKNWVKVNLGEDITDNDIVFPNELSLPHTDKIGLEKEMFYNKEVFYPEIDKSDFFIYTNDFTEDGHMYFTEGVKKELCRAIDKRKSIFRWVRNNYLIDVNDISNAYNVGSLSKKSLTPLILKTSKRNEWILKSIQDYQKWFDNNPEAIDFLDNQFKTYKDSDGSILTHGMVSHFNSLYRTNNHTKVVWTECKGHRNARNFGDVGGGLQDKHAYMVLTRQQAYSVCPYLGTGSESPGYTGRKLDYWGNKGNEGKIEQLLKTRTLHKTMLILREDAFENGMGIYDDMSPEAKIRQASKIVTGVEPLFDFDISGISKKAGLNFFSPIVYEEYCKIQVLMHTWMPEWFPGYDYKFAFSGNGLYCISEPQLFEQHEINWLTFRVYWKGLEEWHIKELKSLKLDDKKIEKEMERYGLIPKLDKLLKENGITHIVTEKKYGWNRYFKALPTFHSSKERVAIPLNKDEPLEGNKKWLDEITNVKLGLDGNVMKEIIKRASWKDWK